MKVHVETVVGVMHYKPVHLFWNYMLTMLLSRCILSQLTCFRNAHLYFCFRNTHLYFFLEMHYMPAHLLWKCTQTVSFVGMHYKPAYMSLKYMFIPVLEVHVHADTVIVDMHYKLTCFGSIC